VLDLIPDGRPVSVERETFPALVERGTLYALGSDAYWLDTGTPDAYLRAHRDLLLGRRGTPPAPGAELDPSLGEGVWRTGAVTVDGGTVSRSLLGSGSSVGAEAVIEESVIGAGAVIEPGASVTGSVLLPGARVASKASVEGSIIGPGAIVGQRCVIHGISVIGAGAVTASGTVIDAGRVAADPEA
jgi:mannose-1-phosphate guanylyltransferase